jgi:hypothetical protein
MKDGPARCDGCNSGGAEGGHQQQVRFEEARRRAAGQTTLPDDVDGERVGRLAVELMLETRT